MTGFLCQYGVVVTTTSRDHSKSLQEQADVLLASLLKAGLGDRPFVLVGHSMGGWRGEGERRRGEEEERGEEKERRRKRSKRGEKEKKKKNGRESGRREKS